MRAHRGRAHEGDGGDVRMRAERIDGALAAVHDVEHAGRHARFDASSASSIGVIGSCSEGLSTKVLPQTIAMGNIHSGIIAGKLNGEMPTHTPIGWRRV